MKLTFPILISLLSEPLFPGFSDSAGGVETLGDAKPLVELRHIRCFDRDDVLHSDTFYLVTEEDLPRFFRQRSAEPVRFAAAGVREAIAKEFRETDSAALLPPGAPLRELCAMLQDQAGQLLGWDAALSQGILRQRESEELFSMGRPVLRRDYAVVDLDMNVAYCTEGYAASRSVTGRRLPREVFQDLAAHREFHEAAEKTGSFYYYNAQTDSTDLCRNIFINGQYIARLVLVLRRGEERLNAGEEQIFAAFADHVQDIYSQRNLRLEQPSRDRLHALCRAVLSGETPDKARTEAILAGGGWAEGHRFTCTVLRFTAGSGWDPQLLTMLPYLAASLEELWPGSCALPLEDAICLVLDHSLPGAPDRRKFHQELAYFIRDNLCKAGISPEFTGFSRLRAARTAAEAALEIGSVRRPDLWYYLFDDCRLDYCASRLRQELPGDMLCHPALELLRSRDAARGTDLLNTLRAYLDCNLNLTAASEQLFIHRTSFCRRMVTIRKITGLDLEDPDTVFLLQLSFRLLAAETARP